LCFIILAEDKLHFFKEQKTDSKSVSESIMPLLNFCKCSFESDFGQTRKFDRKVIGKQWPTEAVKVMLLLLLVSN